MGGKQSTARRRARLTPPWRIFLSHTTDLRNPSAGHSFVTAAEAAVLRAGHAVTDMAYFTARDQEPADYCMRMLADADVYVAVISLAYGTPVRGRPQLSYTELECETATALGLPRLVFIIRSDSPALPTVSQPAERQRRQDMFRQRLQDDNQITVAWIDTPADLEIRLFQALVELAQYSQPTQRSRPSPLATASIEKLSTVSEMIEWLGTSSAMPTTQVNARVARQLGRMDTHSGQNGRTVPQQQKADALTRYYGIDRLAASGLHTYSVRVDHQRLDVAIACRPEWRACSIPLIGRTVDASNPRETCALIGVQPAIVRMPPEVVDAAIHRLALAVTNGTVMLNRPLYRLVRVSCSSNRIDMQFGLDCFAHYALIYDLLAWELDAAINSQPHVQADSLPIRKHVLPDVDVLTDLPDRLCAGGLDCLFAIARPGTQRRSADFMLVVVRRSGRVLAAPGNLSLVPQAVHQHLVDASEEVALSTTLMREFDEELFGRLDVDEGGGRGHGLSPHHPSQASAPLRWLLDHDALLAECTAFGISLADGNYVMACLASVADETFWKLHGGNCLPNWEASDVQIYSTADAEGLRTLILDQRWTSEGLFCLLAGLGRLKELYPDRVHLPCIETVH